LRQQRTKEFEIFSVLSETHSGRLVVKKLSLFAVTSVLERDSHRVFVVFFNNAIFISTCRLLRSDWYFFRMHLRFCFAVIIFSVIF